MKTKYLNFDDKLTLYQHLLEESGLLQKRDQLYKELVTLVTYIITHYPKDITGLIEIVENNHPIRPLITRTCSIKVDGTLLGCPKQYPEQKALKKFGNAVGTEFVLSSSDFWCPVETKKDAYLYKYKILEEALKTTPDAIKEQLHDAIMDYVGAQFDVRNFLGDYFTNSNAYNKNGVFGNIETWEDLKNTNEEWFRILCNIRGYEYTGEDIKKKKVLEKGQKGTEKLEAALSDLEETVKTLYIE